MTGKTVEAANTIASPNGVTITESNVAGTDAHRDGASDLRNADRGGALSWNPASKTLAECPTRFLQ